MTCFSVLIKPKNDRRGFTLVEMLMVAAMIIVLISIAIPNFLNAMERSRRSQCKVMLGILKSSATQYHSDTRQWPESGSEHLYYILGGIFPFGRPSQNYKPPYHEFNSSEVAGENYDYNVDAQIKLVNSPGDNPQDVSRGGLFNSPYRDVRWRPVLDPWGRPVVYVSPDDLKKRFNKDSDFQRSIWRDLIALGPEIGYNDNGDTANLPFGLTSGQFWSAGKDGITARSTESDFALRYGFQPGNLAFDDGKDNDGDGRSDVSDLSGGDGGSAEDDINSW